MKLHIIGGMAKGTRLQALRGRKMRPTPGVVREALFDILGNRVMTARFLDVFAGSGAVGIEALSRGAERLTAIEDHRAAVKILRRNVERCRFERQAEVIHFDAADALMMLNNRQQLFDLVYLDPPYGDSAGERALTTLGRYPVARPGGLIIFEHFHKYDPGQVVGQITRSRLERWGDTCLSFYLQP